MSAGVGARPRAPEDRTARLVRFFLFLSAADSAIFLAAAVAGLLPLVDLGEPFLPALAGTTIALAVGGLCTILAALRLDASARSWHRAVAAGVAGALLILGVAIYFLTAMPVFGFMGPVFVVLAVPGLGASGMAAARRSDR